MLDPFSRTIPSQRNIPESLIQKPKTIRNPDGDCPQELPNQKKSNNNIAFLIIVQHILGVKKFLESIVGLDHRRGRGNSPFFPLAGWTYLLGIIPDCGFMGQENQGRSPTPKGAPLSIISLFF
jgi:hypothetical protein